MRCGPVLSAVLSISELKNLLLLLYLTLVAFASSSMYTLFRFLCNAARLYSELKTE